MAYIERNDNGSIVVNDKVLEKLIIEELLGMSESVVLCNKKGKVIKPTPFADSAYYDAIVLTDTIKENSLHIYLITIFGESISNITDEIFKRIDAIFDCLSLKRIEKIVVNIKGSKTKSGVIAKRDIEVEHSND